METTTTPLLVLDGVGKAYPGEGDSLRVLEAVNLTLDEGETMSIMGPSGCGKSTLLNLISGLDFPSEGRVLFRGAEVSRMTEKESANFRNASIGFVFQQHHLLPHCTALENVLAPSLIHPDAASAPERARYLLERVGLSDRVNHLPGLLSGGERQRVAVARALVNKPALLLADEPTGSLSEAGADALTQLLVELNKEEGIALLLVTHAPRVANRMGRVYPLHEGRLGAFTNGEAVSC